ncbi:conserved putative restriction endonuclease [Melbournevirus]|uniref:conserved putative restriction endonuclease n=1 Tax=Melbournevirus TaxID=1560514 RepID=UPI00051F5C67|nr:conserved putative restriction endonuclease [Melbournevirus]AIT54922.1 zinc-ribbon-containing protein [Melbournevirus]
MVECKPKGKLCGRRECHSCFSRSFASCDEAQFLVDKNLDALLIAKSSKVSLSFECSKCERVFVAKPCNISKRRKGRYFERGSSRFCPHCSCLSLCDSEECKTCLGRSFASHEKAECWDSERNGKSPRKVFVGSQKKFWFKCGECKHSFETKLVSIRRGYFCPFCEKRRVCDIEECEICGERKG